jgi:hypothetical protein
MFEDINEVEYRLYTGKWERLEVMGAGFHKMEKAIEFVRLNEKFHGMKHSVQLRLKEGNNYVEWDNF